MAQSDSRKLEKTKTPGVFKRGDSYIVRWKFRGQSHKQFFPTYAEAREFKRSLSGAGKRPTTAQTVADYYEGWIDSYRGRTARGLEATTRDEYRRSFALHVLPYPIAREKVRDVTSRDVSDWFTGMERKGVRAPSIRKAKAAMSTMMATAAQAGDIQANPVIGVRYVPTTNAAKKKQRRMTVENANAIIEAMEPRWRPFFQLLAESGLRVGEALGLRWQAVHLGDDPHLYVVEQVYRGERKRLKTEGSERTLPLSSGMARTLTELKADSDHADDDRPVFPSEAGTPISYGNLYNRVLIPALRQAGIGHEREDGKWDNEGIGFHSFRKLAGSVLSARAGRPRCRSNGGSATRKTTTMNVYQHELDDGLGGADALDGVWGHPGATEAPQTAANEKAPEARKPA